ncbi:carbamoyltransferase family protein [Amycolatopsis cihanbeyliensis]|uniref:Beta-1,4-N-acetylglucosamine oligosaccharide 3-O-carbamoyltransferase NolO n=1 Tax=Amycolatopsis cihanbeyliensis TaxID=1128664 RepID=A0A542DBJ6_AMYCI|nr:carbamoyltransferase [Amycolatopsis cihanbeyliensis]TQJ00436.1 beta-1,4-N-acetylglucosamine oligosaccharide 3-O-carbamoyltransferase NolO [Amycolatopsis cihanbeyliensis]
MLVLGFSGGLNRVHENPFQLPRALTHDGAAAIVRDGEVVAAIEEERLNRIKHSNKFPRESIQFCLDTAGATIDDVDRFAFYATEEYCDALLARMFLTVPEMPQRPTARGLVSHLLEQEFGRPIDPAKIDFTRHHLAHGVSATAMSGFDRSLLLAIDGYGDFLSGLVGTADGASVTEIASFPQRKSLGLLYLDVIQFVGYKQFDEYKVMGLAPYGDPSVYRDLLREIYQLLPGGDYELDLDRIVPALLPAIEVRKKGQPFTQQHKDLSAALQEALETIVLHVLAHHRETTGLTKLAMAGGVALNCTMNGKIAESGMFDDLFVQPAAHDAGCALGAALLVSDEHGKPAPRRPLRHVYWGTDIGEEAAIKRELEGWCNFLSFDRMPDVTLSAAVWLAKGSVIGWVQGRSEFGPRALGHRSILADPRPAANRERVNQVVKKREGYRPFAPSVLEEDARDYFELPSGTDSYPFMITVFPVKEDKRSLLPAVTHVDGSARPQTVSREVSPRYWELINVFRRLTGVPVLLNTSFNNNVEPIVDSVEDAIVSFLTTELDCLVIGDFVARRIEPRQQDWLGLHISLLPHIRLQQTKGHTGPAEVTITAELRTTYDARFSHPLSERLATLLMGLHGERPVGELFADEPADNLPVLLKELVELWELRLIRLRPVAGRGESR